MPCLDRSGVWGNVPYSEPKNMGTVRFSLEERLNNSKVLCLLGWWAWRWAWVVLSITRFTSLGE